MTFCSERYIPLVLASVLALSGGCASSDEDSPSDADGTGGQDSGTGGSAPSSPQALNLQPLSAGSTWTYQVTTNRSCDGYEESLTRVMTALGVMSGLDSFELDTAFCEPFGEIIAYQEEELAEDFGNWWVRLAGPVAEGTEWNTPTGSVSYTSVPSVSVPAGDFENCWERTPMTASATTYVFCPDVGIVRVLQTNYLAELSSYEIK